MNPCIPSPPSSQVFAKQPDRLSRSYVLKWSPAMEISFPRCFPKFGQSDNSTFIRQSAWLCRMVSAVIHERLCLFIPVPFQSLFFGTFSLQAARIMRSQAGIHPGRLFSFQGVNVCIGMAIIASYTYWAPEDRNVSCSEKNMEFYVCTLDPLSIYFLIIKSHFLPLYFPENK